MTQSEVELMKAENAELKQALVNFGKNYNKFEDLTLNLIRQSNAEQQKLLNELHSRQEQKLNAMRTSNEEVSKTIAGAVKGMTSEIKGDITTIYDKIQKDTAQSLKKHSDSIKALTEQSKRSWAFVGLKEALFWSMCLSIIVMVCRATFDAWGVEIPAVIWQLAYPGSFIPLVFYVVRKFVEKNTKN
jgi:hypothetical protein